MTTLSAIQLKDWEQCRATIGRFDTILADLRKYSFSLITGFITASAFLNYVGVRGGSDDPVVPAGARSAAIAVIMVLIACLYAVDNYYQVLLSGAVERALDLEATMPNLRVTRYIGNNVRDTKSTPIVVGLYLFLLVAAGALAKAMFPDTFAPFQWYWPGIVVILAFVLSGAFIVGYFLVSSFRANTTREKVRDWVGEPVRDGKADTKPAPLAERLRFLITGRR